MTACTTWARCHPWSGPTTCCATSPEPRSGSACSTPGTEVPDRARVLLDAVTAAGAEVVPRQPHDDSVLRTVHDPGLLHHLATVADDWAAGEYEALVGQDRVVPYFFPTAGMLDGLPAHAAGRDARAGRGVVLRHDDAGRPGHLGGGPGGRRRRADGRRPGRRRCAVGVRPGPAAGSPRDPARVRRLLLPEQRGGRRRGAARARPRPGRGRRHRRAPRQRHPGGVLAAAATCSTARCTSTRAPAGSRTSSGTRRRRGTGAGAGHDVQPAARAGHRRRRLAGGAGRRAATGRAARRPWSCRSASTPPAPTRRARSRSAPTASGARASCSPAWGCRPCWCTRAATTSTRLGPDTVAVLSAFGS